MIPIGLITCKEYPNLYPDDTLIIEPLKSFGFDPQIVIWNDTSIQWDTYKALLIRSPWDYYLHLNEFFSWLQTIEKYGIPVWNPLSIIRWSIDKYVYLQDLQKKHIPIIPSVFIVKDSPTTLEEVMKRQRWDAAIVKPRFGGSGFGIFKVTTRDVHKKEDVFRNMLQKDIVIVQPFIQEIQEGEYSFIFFNGVFSHAILKTPRWGEYRINASFGGVWKKVSASEEFVQQAQKVYDVIPHPVLYARIDMLHRNNTLILNELELSDPLLFFKWCPEAAMTFASSFRELHKKTLRS